MVGLLQESDPELKHAEGFGDEESDGLDEDDDDNEDETNESDDDNDEESVDEIPTKGAIVKSSHRETFDMDDRDDDSYYTVSSGKSAEHDGAADESVTARLPPEPTSARLPLPLSLSNPNVVTDASEKIEGLFIFTFLFTLNLLSNDYLDNQVKSHFYPYFNFINT